MSNDTAELEIQKPEPEKGNLLKAFGVPIFAKSMLEDNTVFLAQRRSSSGELYGFRRWQTSQGGLDP